MFRVENENVKKKLQSYCKLFAHQLLLRKLDCNSRMDCKIITIVESAVDRKRDTSKEWILTLFVAKHEDKPDRDIFCISLVN